MFVRGPYMAAEPPIGWQLFRALPAFPPPLAIRWQLLHALPAFPPSLAVALAIAPCIASISTVPGGRARLGPLSCIQIYNAHL
jgi:hypothetical protein